MQGAELTRMQGVELTRMQGAELTRMQGTELTRMQRGGAYKNARGRSLQESKQKDGGGGGDYELERRPIATGVRDASQQHEAEGPEIVDGGYEVTAPADTRELDG